MGGGTSKTLRTEQRRRCSYPSLEDILRVLGRSLGSREVWPIDLVEVGLATPSVFEAPPPGYAVL